MAEARLGYTPACYYGYNWVIDKCAEYDKNGNCIKYDGSGNGSEANAGSDCKVLNEDMSMVVKEVKVIDPDLKITTLNKEELGYAYRDSFLKRNKDYVCIETTFEMKYKDKDKIKEVMNDRKNRRVVSQPLDKPSAGSVFRNPPGMSAGKLIEDAGLKGYIYGGAMISDKHANFIINNDTATYEDIIMLIDYIKERIKIIYDIDLILEQEIIR